MRKPLVVRHPSPRRDLVLLLGIATGLAGAGTARADARISSGAQEPLTISFELPSGESAQRSLNAAGQQVATDMVPTKDRATQAVVITNPAGAIVAKGTVADNKAYVLMPNGKGAYRFVQSGFVTPKDGKLAGVVVVNSLPGTYSVDLFGANGKYGVKGVEIGTSFDLKSATMLTSGGEEDRYKVVVRSADGSRVTAQNQAFPGDCLLIHMDGDGVVTASNVGSMAAPAAPSMKPTKPKAKSK
jgi:hypothetical protein